MHLPAHDVDRRAEDEAERHAQRHHADRQEEEHGQDDLGRHGEARADLELDARRHRVGEDEEDEDAGDAARSEGVRNANGTATARNASAPTSAARSPARRAAPAPGAGVLDQPAGLRVELSRRTAPRSSPHRIFGARHGPGLTRTGDVANGFPRTRMRGVPSRRHCDSSGKERLRSWEVCCGTSYSRLAASLALTAPAYAGTFGDSAVPCEGRTAEQPFKRWLDPMQYALAPNGDLERGGAEWKLAGGARVVEGNETFYVGGARDSHSLTSRPAARRRPGRCASSSSTRRCATSRRTAGQPSSRASRSRH